MGLKSSNLLQIWPHHLKQYLAEVGFSKIESWGEDAEVWKSKDGPIIIPLRHQSEDYEDAVRDVIEKLSKFQSLPRASIYQEVVNNGFNRWDTIARSSETKSGNISFDLYPDLMMGLKPILRSAGCSVLQQRPMHLGPPPRQVDALMKQTMVGQTEISSYAMKFFIPKQIELEQKTMLFGQHSIETLCLSFATIQSIAKAGRYDSDKVSALPLSGVTVNICESIAHILRLGERQSLELLFKFSIFDETILQRKTSEYRFDCEDSEILRQLGNSLRKQVKEDKFELKGYVIGLGRDQNQTCGNVLMLGKVGSSRKKVRFTLQDPNYGKIVLAHKDGCEVSVTGTLKFTKSKYFLEDAGSVRILGKDLSTEASLLAEQLSFDLGEGADSIEDFGAE